MLHIPVYYLSLAGRLTAALLAVGYWALIW